MKTRQEIKARGREALREQRGTAICLFLAVMGVSIISSIIDQTVFLVTGAMGLLYWIVFIVGMLVIYVAMINMYGGYLKIYNGEKASAGDVFTEIPVNFLRKLGGYMWMMLFVFLWSMLFVIPGIIKSFAYWCTPFILASCPKVEARQALKLSMRMTDGYKMDIFIFSLSFIGWWILSFFTCFILAFVFVGPYYSTSAAGLYAELRDKAIADGKITPEELGMEPKPSTDYFAIESEDNSQF